MARTFKTSLPDLPTIYNISDSVGHNLPNKRDDVMLVQMLMKMAGFTRVYGGLPAESSRSIKIDGYFGPQTQRMIKAFEVLVKSQKLLLVEDGFFEPATSDGFNGSGVLYKMIYLNRFAKKNLSSEYKLLPKHPDTNMILRVALNWE